MKPMYTTFDSVVPIPLGNAYFWESPEGQGLRVCEIQRDPEWIFRTRFGAKPFLAKSSLVSLTAYF